MGEDSVNWWYYLNNAIFLTLLKRVEAGENPYDVILDYHASTPTAPALLSAPKPLSARLKPAIVPGAVIMTACAVLSSLYMTSKRRS